MSSESNPPEPVTRSAPTQERASDASIDVAWLHYVGGLTQAEIAKQRGLSKATVHRLLRAAHESGAVCVFIDAQPSAEVELEQQMIARFGLTSCRLVPSTITGEEQIRDGVASLAARSLLSQLEVNKNAVIGLGVGRTLTAMARAFPRARYPDVEFVSLTGDFSVFRTGHSTDVLRRLADRTGGRGYAIAAPILANSETDRNVLMAQSGTRIALQKTRDAKLAFVGVGHLGEGSFLQAFNLVDKAELEELRALGAVADFCGTLLDADGQPVDCDVARRVVACHIDELAKKRNTAIAFGTGKIPAILSVLRAGLVAELISDTKTAELLLKSDWVAG
ncbi:sugar-binding transcriptional regulator [Oricola sp.]|uniref:sugar-binding transcriptional regulator n=1 Tax=Oricola sp. TaxID=1979950 RepID=UPI003BA8D67F